MAIFANLAKLRPMVSAEELLKLIGPEAQPSPGGWIRIGACFLARTDSEGKISLLEFGEITADERLEIERVAQRAKTLGRSA